MKTTESEAKETSKENEAAQEGESLKADGERERLNGSVEMTKPTTNGIVANFNGDASQDDMTVGTPTPNGKGKLREVDGGMISPESLEAT